MNIVVLGAGMVGKAMAIDLNIDKNFNVTIVDKNSKILERLKEQYQLQTMQMDLSDRDQVAALVADFDLVIGAVPGFMGYQTLQTVIEAGVDVIDISFFPEDPFGLDKLAKDKGVTAIMDCGMAPGLSNILVGHAVPQLTSVEEVKIYVGGLPVYRQWPFEYKAVFSPVDVIEEYTRPARFVESGKIITRPALSEPELINFREIGTLEAFNTDGLRTLLKTIKAPFLKEKTLRYPGHVEKIKILRDSGFFSQQPVEISGKTIAPLDLSSKLLFSMWHLDEGDEDFTIMSVAVIGKKGSKKIHYNFYLLDRYDHYTNTTSMARTTGYTATVTARLLATGKFTQKGIIPPEFLGREQETFDFIREGLEQRDIFVDQIVEEEDGGSEK